jgi:hypothetical protein
LSLERLPARHEFLETAQPIIGSAKIATTIFESPKANNAAKMSNGLEIAISENFCGLDNR